MAKLTATFPDGAVLRRVSLRDYTHAWRVCWLRPLNGDGKPVDTIGHVYVNREGSESGFATSMALARKAAGTAAKRVGSWSGYEITKHEVVNVIAAPARRVA